MDTHDDQRGRIIGSCVAIFIITDLFVLLRLVSRKFARAGYWVRTSRIKSRDGVDRDADCSTSGMMFSPLLRW